MNIRKYILTDICILLLLLTGCSEVREAQKNISAEAETEQPVQEETTGDRGNEMDAVEAVTSVGETELAQEAIQQPTEIQSTDSVVIYFSRGINTDITIDTVSGASLTLENGIARTDAQPIAEWIAEETGSDLYAIRTIQKYPAPYDDVLDYARMEKTNGERPALVEEPIPLEQYDTVFFVYPNWWGDLPMPVYTFFETYDFSGKRLVAVVTSGGSAFSNTIATLEQLEPEAEIKRGIDIFKGDMDRAKEDVENWIRENDY